MCTVTVLPRAAGFRLVCNRDEQRTRAAAEPPAVRQFGGVQALSPIDPVSRGTWIAANDAGLVLVLLNRNPRGRPPVPAPISRGTIIPALLPQPRLAGVVHTLGGLPLGLFEPFTVVALQQRHFVVARNVAGRLSCRAGRLLRPLFFTSSSLGDAVVWLARRRLFTRLIETGADRWLGQMLFHRHAWRSRPEISVLMRRADAATVSRTTVDVDRGFVRMRYEPLWQPPCC